MFHMLYPPKIYKNKKPAKNDENLSRFIDTTQRPMLSKLIIPA